MKVKSKKEKIKRKNNQEIISGYKERSVDIKMVMFSGVL